jgi:hypothetical protein
MKIKLNFDGGITVGKVDFEMELNGADYAHAKYLMAALNGKYGKVTEAVTRSLLKTVEESAELTSKMVSRASSAKVKGWDEL